MFRGRPEHPARAVPRQVLSRLWLAEPLSGRRRAAVALSLAGVALIAAPAGAAGAATLRGALLALAAVGCAACYKAQRPSGIEPR